jgi:hypothetical protein
MKTFAAVLLLSISTGEVIAQQPSGPQTLGKFAARPLYRDPVFDHPTDPVLTYNAET